MSREKITTLTSVAGRLEFLVEKVFEGKWAAFMRAAGINPGSAARYKKGEGNPSLAQAIQICNVSGVQPNWLLTGEGPMFSSKKRGAGKMESSDGEPHGEGEAPPGVIDLQLLPQAVAAGGGAFRDDGAEPETYKIDERYFRQRIGLDPRQVRVVPVVGDSMQPTLAPNDLIMVNVAPGQPVADGIWMVRLGDAYQVKRVQVLVGRKLRLLSDNAAYGPQELDLTMEQPDFELVGRVVWGPREF